MNLRLQKPLFDLPCYLKILLIGDCTLVKNPGTIIMPKVHYNTKTTL